MSYNGSGLFQINSTGQPVSAGTTIDPAVHNALTADLATGLSNAICKDGQTTITANIPLNGNKLTGVGAATARTDAATLANVQDGTGVYVATVGGTADVITLTPSPAITSYGAGQAFAWLSSGANTTNVTVNVSGLGAKAVTKNGTTALVAGDIPANAMVHARYDGTRFILLAVIRDFLPITGGTLTGNLLFTDATYDIGASGATRPRDLYLSRNAVVGSALTVTGGQIVFPAVQNPSSNANTLDDYEEGTWTPSVGGNATYLQQSATYTKIGRLVTITCYLAINVLGTGSVNTISGLPFTVASYALGPCRWSSTAVAPVNLNAYAAPGGTTVTMVGNTGASAGDTTLNVFGNSAEVIFSLTYPV